MQHPAPVPAGTKELGWVELLGWLCRDGVGGRGGRRRPAGWRHLALVESFTPISCDSAPCPAVPLPCVCGGGGGVCHLFCFFGLFSLWATPHCAVSSWLWDQEPLLEGPTGGGWGPFRRSVFRNPIIMQGKHLAPSHWPLSGPFNPAPSYIWDPSHSPFAPSSSSSSLCPFSFLPLPLLYPPSVPPPSMRPLPREGPEHPQLSPDVLWVAPSF